MRAQAPSSCWPRPGRPARPQRHSRWWSTRSRPPRRRRRRAPSPSPLLRTSVPLITTTQSRRPLRRAALLLGPLSLPTRYRRLHISRRRWPPRPRCRFRRRPPRHARIACAVALRRDRGSPNPAVRQPGEGEEGPHPAVEAPPRHRRRTLHPARFRRQQTRSRTTSRMAPPTAGASTMAQR